MDKVSCELRFSGLIAFVAPIGFRTTRKADSIDVLLVDVAQSTFLNLPIHTPTLEIPEAAIKNGPPSDTKLPPNFKPKLAQSRVYLLANQQLTFERPAKALNRGVRGAHNAGNTTLPTGTRWKDLKWLPDLEKVRGQGKGRLQASVGRNDPRTSSIFSLESGKLEARSPSVAGFETVECGFVPAVPGISVPKHKQILTDTVVFITDPVATLTIVLTPHGGGKPKRIELAPGAATIPVEVCNENTTGAITLGDTIHFAAFYDLIDPTLTPEQRLVPHALKPIARTQQDSPAFCPPPSHSGKRGTERNDRRESEAKPCSD